MHSFAVTHLGTRHAVLPVASETQTRLPPSTNPIQSQVFICIHALQLQSLRYISFQLGYAQAHSYLSKLSELQQNLAVEATKGSLCRRRAFVTQRYFKDSQWAQQLLCITKLSLRSSRRKAALVWAPWLASSTTVTQSDRRPTEKWWASRATWAPMCGSGSH